MKIFKGYRKSIPMLQDWVYVAGYTFGFLIWCIGVALPNNHVLVPEVEYFGVFIFCVFVLWGWIDSWVSHVH